MDITHSVLKRRYEQHRETIARSVNSQYKPEINMQAFRDAQTAALDDLKQWRDEHEQFYTETRAEMEAKAGVILPDSIDANRAEYTRATLTRRWTGMNVRDIQKEWQHALKTGDKTAAWVYMQHAPYAIAENMQREAPVMLEGTRPRRWDGKPYQGKDVLELMDKSLQLAAPDAHAAKERIVRLDAEMQDVKIGYSIAHTTIEGLKYSDKDGVTDGLHESARSQITANF